MKYFRMSYEEVVFNRSYANIILLNRSIPSYNFDKDDEEEEKPSSKRATSPKKRVYRNEEDFFMSLM